MKTDGTILYARCFRELPAFEAMRSRFFTPDELVARMDREGLEKIFVCPVVNVDPRMQNLFAACERVGLSVTFHVAGAQDWMYGVVDDPGLPGLEASLKRFPMLKFFGHAQAFWSEIGTYRDFDERVNFPKGPVRNGRLPELFRKYPNLYGDLSAGSGYLALARDREHAVKFLTDERSPVKMRRSCWWLVVNC